MARKKKIRINAVKNFTNVFCNEEIFQNFFNKVNKEVILELGCGKGEYTLALAEKFSNKFFIGIDIKADRIWHGAKQALEKNLENVVFLQINILNLEKFLKSNAISEIWITFPDPQPKERNEKRRLTHPKFLEIYKKILKPNGIIHLKTDHEGLFKFTLDILKNENPNFGFEILKAYENIYEKNLKNEILEIQTRYEKKHLEMGAKIKYLSFQKL